MTQTRLIIKQVINFSVMLSSFPHFSFDKSRLVRNKTKMATVIPKIAAI